MHKVNLACGPVFVASADWINVDFAPSSSAVRKANLLDRLPLTDESVAVVYSSHFLEHVPRSSVPALLCECFRILKSDGVLRLVLPDLENMAREYLQMREHGEHDKADFVVFELIDQCVRRESGGEMGRLYQTMRNNPGSVDTPMRSYVRQRVGEDCGTVSGPEAGKALLRELRRIPSALFGRLQRLWIRLCILLLPTAFRSQNISLAAVGERHHWLWDFYQLKTALESVGFTQVQRQSASRSTIRDFPFYPLDIDANGYPRKGENSMYIEAIKP